MANKFLTDWPEGAGEYIIAGSYASETNTIKTRPDPDPGYNDSTPIEVGDTLEAVVDYEITTGVDVVGGHLYLAVAAFTGGEWVVLFSELITSYGDTIPRTGSFPLYVDLSSLAGEEWPSVTIGVTDSPSVQWGLSAPYGYDVFGTLTITPPAEPEPEPGTVETPIFEPFTSEPNAEGYARLRLETRGAGFSVPGQALGLVRVEFNTYGYGEGDYGGVIEPGIPANGLAGVNFTVGGTGYGRGVSFGGATVDFTTKGYSTAPGFGAGGATLLFRTVGVAPSANAGDGYLVDRDPMVSGFGGHWFAVEHDALALSTHATHLHTVVLRAMLAYGDTQHGRFEGAFTTTDALALGDHASWLLRVLTEDGLVLGAEATPDYLAVARAIETLLASGAAEGYVEAVSLVLDAMVLRTLADGFDYERAVDTALLAAAVADAYTALGGVLDRLLTSPTATGAQRLTTLVRDDIEVGGDASAEATFHSALRDSLGLAAHLSLDTGEYVAWVVNPQSAGVSTYRNYPFNSFASLGGRYYGATSQGLFLLEGEDDDGEAIDARIRLGLHDMNTRKLKRLPEAYIGYKSDGNLILRVIIADDQTGEKVALEYLMRPRAAPALRESRFITGRGVKAVDWDFEIENIDGADFDLADVEFHPLVMDRRTRG